MICPECSKQMTRIPFQTPVNHSTDTWREKWRCEPCKLVGMVETSFWHDESADAVSEQP